MLRKILPALLALLGLAVGAGAGFQLRPAAPDSAGDPRGGQAAEGGAPASGHGADDAAAPDAIAPAKKDAETTRDYVKMNNQFIVPIVLDGQVAALVILSISLEVTAGSTEKVYQVEPKLRDGFLQVLFDHANAGGFMGTFTDGSNMILLRQALREVAQSILGPDVTDILIVDIVRQDS